MNGIDFLKESKRMSFSLRAFGFELAFYSVLDIYFYECTLTTVLSLMVRSGFKRRMINYGYTQNRWVRKGRLGIYMF